MFRPLATAPRELRSVLLSVSCVVTQFAYAARTCRAQYHPDKVTARGDGDVAAASAQFKRVQVCGVCAVPDLHIEN